MRDSLEEWGLLAMMIVGLPLMVAIPVFLMSTCEGKQSVIVINNPPGLSKMKRSAKDLVYIKQMIDEYKLGQQFEERYVSLQKIYDKYLPLIPDEDTPKDIVDAIDLLSGEVVKLTDDVNAKLKEAK